MTYSLANIGDIIRLGGHDWRVLDINEGKALVVSDKILLVREYGSNSAWESCDLNWYLNGEFYSGVFAADEKAMITKADGTGKIFILSVQEVVRYFGDSGQLSAGNKYINDQFNQARASIHADTGEALWWWLRVPGCPDNLAMCVGDDGCIYASGHGITVGSAGSGGVRPAFWLAL